MGYFKKSHKGGNTVKGDEIINLEKDDDLDRLDNKLMIEIDKFNLNKIRKQVKSFYKHSKFIVHLISALL